MLPISISPSDPLLHSYFLCLFWLFFFFFKSSPLIRRDKATTGYQTCHFNCDHPTTSELLPSASVCVCVYVVFFFFLISAIFSPLLGCLCFPSEHSAPKFLALHVYDNTAQGKSDFSFPFHSTPSRPPKTVHGWY